MSLTQNDVDHEQRNKKFVEAIRETARNRIQFEDELLPLLMHYGGTGREPARCQTC